MKEVDFISQIHKSTRRDYLGRVNSKKFPKSEAARLAKKFDFDYWDGDREICYGGYKYIKGRSDNLVHKMINYYNLNSNSSILDIGCGKGYLLYDFTRFLPGIKVQGIDISEYAIKNSKEEVKPNLMKGNAAKLPFPDNHFDLVLSINTLHCLQAYELFDALKEMERVGKKDKYLCVESFRNEEEKANLLYWQVTCEAFNSPKAWQWWFTKTGYKGDYSFIYFE